MTPCATFDALPYRRLVGCWSDYYDEALKLYNRSIELNPGLDEPYMYRGVLYIQMGDVNLVLAGHKTLVDRNSQLASELQFVVEDSREKEPEPCFGVSSRIDT